MLERSEELAEIGSWEWDLTNGTLRWSDNLFRLFGLAPGEITPPVEYVLGRTYADDRERVRRALDGTAATGHLEPIEYRIVRSGGVRLLRAKVGELRKEGRTTRLVGYVHDITEGRQIAREIAGHIASWEPGEAAMFERSRYATYDRAAAVCTCRGPRYATFPSAAASSRSESASST